MFKKTTLFLAASAALAGSARAAITDSICDYLEAMNTCAGITTGQTACNAETNCGYSSGAGICLTSDFADGTVTSFSTAKAQTDADSVAFKAMFDACAGYSGSDQATCEATASEHCEWEPMGQTNVCGLDLQYYATFATNECDIDVADTVDDAVAAATSATVVASSTIAAVAAGIAVAGLA
jgi:hypothetical protein